MENDSTVQRSAKKRLPPNAGKGRVKGVPNKITATMKEMLAEALEKVGGPEYLARMAEEQPAAFLSLLGRLVPSEVRAELSAKDPIYHLHGDLIVTGWEEAKDIVVHPPEKPAIE